MAIPPMHTIQVFQLIRKAPSTGYVYASGAWRVASRPSAVDHRRKIASPRIEVETWPRRISSSFPVLERSDTTRSGGACLLAEMRWGSKRTQVQW
jgi:hypothetical protein